MAAKRAKKQTNFVNRCRL